MRFSFVPSPDSPPNFGKLVEDETGDLIGFGTFYKTATERDALKERVARLEAALRKVVAELDDISPYSEPTAALLAEARAALTNDAGEGA